MSLLIVLFTLAVVALIVDGYQTLQIALHPEKWQEVGWAHWWLGTHPTPTGAVMYFAFWIFVMAAVFFQSAIPMPAKIAVFVITAVIEGYTVVKNFKVGIR